MLNEPWRTFLGFNPNFRAGRQMGHGKGLSKNTGKLGPINLRAINTAQFPPRKQKRPSRKDRQEFRLPLGTWVSFRHALPPNCLNYIAQCAATVREAGTGVELLQVRHESREPRTRATTWNTFPFPQGNSFASHHTERTVKYKGEDTYMLLYSISGSLANF